MLSCTADYALRAILLLARVGSDRPLRADEIADATGAPRNYLAKTLNALPRNADRQVQYDLFMLKGESLLQTNSPVQAATALHAALGTAR